MTRHGRRADGDRLGATPAPPRPPRRTRSRAGWLALSFRFLLARESKELILRTFDLPVIGRYFPEYERDIAR